MIDPPAWQSPKVELDGIATGDHVQFSVTPDQFLWKHAVLVFSCSLFPLYWVRTHGIKYYRV
jgi:hypothetical protein